MVKWHDDGEGIQVRYYNVPPRGVDVSRRTEGYGLIDSNLD